MRSPALYLGLGAALLLLIAPEFHGRGYFVFLRWTVSGAALWFVWWSARLEKFWGCCVFGGVLVLFNPIVPIHMARHQWQTFDLVTAAVFVSSAFALSQAPRLSAQSAPRTGADWRGQLVAYTVGPYVMSVSVAVVYFGWQQAHERTFLDWLIFGTITAGLKAVIWPYFAFFARQGP